MLLRGRSANVRHTGNASATKGNKLKTSRAIVVAGSVSVLAVGIFFYHFHGAGPDGSRPASQEAVARAGESSAGDGWIARPELLGARRYRFSGLYDVCLALTAGRSVVGKPPVAVAGTLNRAPSAPTNHTRASPPGG